MWCCSSRYGGVHGDSGSDPKGAGERQAGTRDTTDHGPVPIPGSVQGKGWWPQGVPTTGWVWAGLASVARGKGPHSVGAWVRGSGIGHHVDICPE